MESLTAAARQLYELLHPSERPKAEGPRAEAPKAEGQEGPKPEESKAQRAFFGAYAHLRARRRQWVVETAAGPKFCSPPPEVGGATCENQVAESTATAT